MVKTVIFGASGYAGAQLVSLVSEHPYLSLNGLYVSPNSTDAHKDIAQLHPSLSHLCGMTVQPTNPDTLKGIAAKNDVILLATPHEASHEWAPLLLGYNAKVYDLSAAFRLSDIQAYSAHYGFEHLHAGLLNDAVYGLAEHYADKIAKANLIAVPGCYPTASLCGLKPLCNASVLDETVVPIINAVSGVSGAGRKAALSNSFCEVSLQAYGIFSHRHTPEISQYINRPVIFTPHLGNFKRGILATITTKVKQGVTQADIDEIFDQAYANSPLIRLQANPVRVDDVANTPFCDLYWKLDPHTQYLIITSAIDNVMKGAASQAIQCINLSHNWPSETGLLGLGK